MWAKCFLQKTALKLVKYGLHSPTYDLHPHIGGRHSVLYFTIQVTEKYSNSNVLEVPVMTVMLVLIGIDPQILSVDQYELKTDYN